jgi:formylmethanofuran:tetrahydromethanopterin formyltransferase
MTSPTNSQEETKTGQKMITQADIANGHFIIPLQWGMEQNTLGATSFILNMSGTVLADPTKHFVEFVRLKDGQITATDDLGICSQVRGLLQDMNKSLTPKASAF